MSAPTTPYPHLTPDKILARVAQRYGLTEWELRSQGNAPAPEARGEVARELQEFYKWSSLRIGKFLGRHHSTVLYGLGRLKSGKPRWIEEKIL